MFFENCVTNRAKRQKQKEKVVGDKKGFSELVKTAALSICGAPPKNITLDDCRKIYKRLHRKMARERVNFYLRELGYKRVFPVSQNKKVLALIATAFKAAQKLESAKELLALKEKLTADISEVLKEFRQDTPEWDTICTIARRRELPGWPHIGQLSKEENEQVLSSAEEKREERPPVTDEQIARFLTRGHSVKEVAATFSLSEEEVKIRLSGGLSGYDIFTGSKNIHGAEVYVAVPGHGNTKPQPKAWEWRQELVEKQPYGVVTFPHDFAYSKLKLIPIDGVYFGDSAHDAKSFDEVVRYIARSPNTFCYLNGDAIAEIKGSERGKDAQEAKHFAYLARASEFVKKMRPIAHKVLFAQQGCLEARALQYQGFDPLAYFCSQHNIPYFDEPVYLDIFWGDKLFPLWTMHGHSTAQVKGAKVNALRRPAQIHDLTHFIIMGHIGDAIWNRQVKICRSTLLHALCGKEEFLLVLGNFRKYFGTRAARRGETPPSNEILVLFMYPNGDYHVKTLHGGQA